MLQNGTDPQLKVPQLQELY